MDPLLFLAIAKALVAMMPANTAPREPHPVLLVMRGEYGVAVRTNVEHALARKGRPVLDAAPMWQDLVFGHAPINMGRIDAPIPTWWPEALRATWESGRNLCVRRAEQPPYGIENYAAYLCGQQLGPVL